jgi:cytochrome c oxidase cbb3-type subunit II
MNHGPLILFGALLTFACSWYGIVFKAQLTMGRDEPVKAESGMYPSRRTGLAQEGLEVYRVHGCAACHTQQVRSREEGSDFDRGWGKRLTVSQDFLYDRVVPSGLVRLGPDLANIGLRMPSPEYHYLHLYNARITAPGSIMPPYRFLFEKRRIQGQPSPDALRLTGSEAPPEGFEIVPRPEARALVSYMLSLQAEVRLFEAPVPVPPTNAVDSASSTNAATPGATNAPATNSSAVK